MSASAAIVMRRGEAGSWPGHDAARILSPDAASADPAPLAWGELMRLNTGWHQSPEAWRDTAARRSELQRQTERIADALELAGVPARQDVGDVVELGCVTRQVGRDEAFRPICFLPLIAQRERRPLLNELRYFQRHHPLGEFMRLAVVTTGERVPLFGPMRERLARLHRRVSRWASEAKRRFGIEVFYRGSEFTIDELLTFHPHANVLFAPAKMLPAHRWQAFLAWTRAFFGAHWHDAGRLASPDEAIKYPFKPADMERLCDNPAGLAWLFHETEGLKIAQPMGLFADWRRERLCERRVSEETGVGSWVRVRKVVMVNRPGGARLEVVAKKERSAPDDDASSDVERENMVLCRAAPQFRFSPYAEPVLRVLNLTEQPRTPEGARRLALIRKWQDEARELWDANGAPDPAVALALARGQAAAEAGEARRVAAFKVHTCRPTVPSCSGGDGASPQDAVGDRQVTPPARPPGAAEALPPTYTMADGTVIDPATGEILWQPAADREALRAGRRAAETAHVAGMVADADARAAEAASRRKFAEVMELKGRRRR